jgi:hypothetical protein
MTFTVAFGFNSKSVTETKNIFRYYGHLIATVEPLRFALASFLPLVLDVLRIPMTNPKASKFFIKLFGDMVEKRKQQQEKRNDFLNLLIELMENEQIIDKNNESSFDNLGASK